MDHGVAPPRSPAFGGARRGAPGRRAVRRARAARRTPRSVGMNASGSRSARIATYSAVQGPMPGSRTRARRTSSGWAPGSITTSPLTTASASATRARRRPAGMANDAGIAFGQREEAAGVGKSRRRSRWPRETGPRVSAVIAGRRQRVACGLHQPARDGACPRHRDLLADHGAHGELEAVGGSGHPAPGITPDRRTDSAIAPQCLRGLRRGPRPGRAVGGSATPRW